MTVILAVAIADQKKSVMVTVTTTTTAKATATNYLRLNLTRMTIVTPFHTRSKKATTLANAASPPLNFQGKQPINSRWF